MRCALVLFLSIVFSIFFAACENDNGLPNSTLVPSGSDATFTETVALSPLATITKSSDVDAAPIKTTDVLCTPTTAPNKKNDELLVAKAWPDPFPAVTYPSPDALTPKPEGKTQVVEVHTLLPSDYLVPLDARIGSSDVIVVARLVEIGASYKMAPTWLGDSWLPVIEFEFLVKEHLTGESEKMITVVTSIGEIKGWGEISHTVYLSPTDARNVALHYIADWNKHWDEQEAILFLVENNEPSGCINASQKNVTNYRFAEQPSMRPEFRPDSGYNRAWLAVAPSSTDVDELLRDDITTVSIEQLKSRIEYVYRSLETEKEPDEYESCLYRKHYAKQLDEKTGYGNIRVFVDAMGEEYFEVPPKLQKKTTLFGADTRFSIWEITWTSSPHWPADKVWLSGDAVDLFELIDRTTETQKTNPRLWTHRRYRILAKGTLPIGSYDVVVNIQPGEFQDCMEDDEAWYVTEVRLDVLPFGLFGEIYLFVDQGQLALNLENIDLEISPERTNRIISAYLDSSSFSIEIENDFDTRPFDIEIVDSDGNVLGKFHSLVADNSKRVGYNTNRLRWKHSMSPRPHGMYGIRISGARRSDDPTSSFDNSTLSSLCAMDIVTIDVENHGSMVLQNKNEGCIDSSFVVLDVKEKFAAALESFTSCKATPARLYWGLGSLQTLMGSVGTRVLESEWEIEDSGFVKLFPGKYTIEIIGNECTDGRGVLLILRVDN